MDGIGASIVIYDPSLETALAAWLDAKHGNTQSDATLKYYRDTMLLFRALLQQHGIDLDGDPALIATTAQGWAARGTRKATVGAATFNMRLAVLSSFYAYAIRKGYPRFTQNPIARVDRRRVQPYANAQSLPFSAVKARLAAIDTSTLEGQRDKTLLMLALTTGRRLTEVAAMRRAHLTMEGARITVTFPRTKGGKIMRDDLTPVVSALLSDYLRATNASGILRDAQAVWVSLSPHNRGKALGGRTIERICEKRLGLQHFHALRHTFAHAMEDQGAKVSEIQARLGHSNMATTGRYLAQLTSGKNPYAEAIEALFTADE